MQQANKEKLINLITRPYKALPLCADLPRLGPFMKLFDQNNKVIVDEAAGGANPAIGVLQILTTLANNIEGEESAEKISDSFLPFFAGSDLGTIAMTLQRFIEEVMGGDNSHVITVLKCVNQTAISPAIIELKFALGNQCMTKDVKLGWKIEFYLKADKILIKSRRKEMCIKNTFQYEWTLTFELARGTWQCTDVYIDIISILFHEDCPEDRRGLVKRLLEKYCNNPAVLIMCDKVEYSADAEGNIKVKPRRMPVPLATHSDDVSPPTTALPIKKPVLDSIEKLGGGSSNSTPVGSPRPQPKAILSPSRPRPLKLDEKTESGLRSAGNSFSELQIAKSDSQEGTTSSDKNSNTSETTAANIASNTQQPSGTTAANGQSSEPTTPVRPQLTLKDSLASLHSKEHVNTVPVPTTPTSPNTPREDLSTQGPASVDSINSALTKEQTKTGSNSSIPSGKKDGVTEDTTTPSNSNAENKTEEVLVKRVKLYPNGDRYEGEFNSKGVRHGKGVYTTTDGNVYVGEYKDGTRHGKGTYTMHNGSRYEGTFERGVPNGKGVYVFQNGDLYMGDFKDDEFHGLGSWSSMAGATFYGEFKQGRRCGKGVFSDRAGNRYEGEWKDDLMHGYGKYKTANGDVYEGNFKEGKFDGQGVYYFAQHGFKVSGDFQAGKIVKMT